MKVGPIGCPQMSVRNYHSTLRKILEECRYDLHCGGSLKSQIYEYVPFYYTEISGLAWFAFRFWKLWGFRRDMEKERCPQCGEEENVISLL